MGFEARTKHRDDLAEFLSTRRARLRPGDVGLPQSPRRRAPGLRREEVALLAGIGVAWYTWLEQGRGVRPSDQALEGIARALRLGPPERAHLFRLARGSSTTIPSRLNNARPLPAGLARVLSALNPFPAYVRTARWDVLAWNKAASLFFTDYGALPTSERNVLRLTFVDPSYRSLLSDWEGDAKGLLAAFRADCSAAAGDPDFAALVSELESLSVEFRVWWRRHDVVGCGAGVRTYNHPGIGQIELEYTALAVADDPELKLIAHTPWPHGEEALSRLADLA